MRYCISAGLIPLYVNSGLGKMSRDEQASGIGSQAQCARPSSTVGSVVRTFHLIALRTWRHTSESSHQEPFCISIMNLATTAPCSLVLGTAGSQTPATSEARVSFLPGRRVTYRYR